MLDLPGVYIQTRGAEAGTGHHVERSTKALTSHVTQGANVKTLLISGKTGPGSDPGRSYSSRGQGRKPADAPVNRG
jgi:hypothetical protein